MRTTVVSGRYTPPILQPAKHVFDFMSMFIQGFVISDLSFSVLLWRNAGRDPLFKQAIPEPISVITAIREKVFGRREVIQQLSRPFVIRHLTRCQIHQHRLAIAITNRMKL